MFLLSFFDLAFRFGLYFHKPSVEVGTIQGIIVMFAIWTVYPEEGVVVRIGPYPPLMKVYAPTRQLMVWCMGKPVFDNALLSSVGNGRSLRATEEELNSFLKTRIFLFHIGIGFAAECVVA